MYKSYYNLDSYKDKFYKKFPDSEIKILEITKGVFIKIQNKYGVCIVQKNNLLNQGKVTIQTSLDKNQYFINQAKEVHGDKYNYSLIDYKGSFEKIKIICKEHNNLFNQLANAHLQGQGCKLCSNDLRKADYKLFIDKSNIVHNNKYDYSLVDYKNCKTKVTITCPIHGHFKQSSNSHLKGQGCPQCGKELIKLKNQNNPTGWDYSNWYNKAQKSDVFESFKVYIIKCYNENEEFYKIGKTFKTIKGRFKTKILMPYNYEIIKFFEGTSLEMSKLEKSLQKLNKENKYKPKLHFKGENECYFKINKYETAIR